MFGLKQAPTQRFAKSSFFLCNKLDFQSCSYDPCFYLKRTTTKTIMITLYVDDLFIAGSRLQSGLNLKEWFCNRIEVEDYSEAKISLGFEISRNRTSRTLKICRQSYTEKILRRFGMKQCKPASTPMDKQPDISSMQGSSFAAQQLSSNWVPHVPHGLYETKFSFLSLLRVTIHGATNKWAVGSSDANFRYIRGTTFHGITCYGQSSIRTCRIGYCDLACAKCKLDWISTTEFVLLSSQGTVSWKFGKQSFVTTSKTEKEGVLEKFF